MRNGLISVDAYKKSLAFYIYERKLRYCIEVFFRVRKRASGNASMEKVLCVSVLVKFPRAETRAFLPQWKAGLRRFERFKNNYLSNAATTPHLNLSDNVSMSIKLLSFMLRTYTLPFLILGLFQQLQYRIRI